jgi:hypothetical protein
MNHPRRAFLAFVLAAVLSVVAVTAIVTHAISPEQVIAGFQAIGDLATLSIVGWLGVKLLAVALDYVARVQTAPRAEPVQHQAHSQENTQPKAQRVTV